MANQPVLDIKGLRTVFRMRDREIAAVNGLDLVVHPGETVALVGESGSGKSVTSLSVLRLLARKVGSIAAGEILSVEDLAYPTECDALQTPQTWPINFAVLQARGVTGVVVTRSEVRHAMRTVFEKLHLVVEPGGAAALAAVLARKVALTDATLVTLSGGNVDPLKFAEIITE